MIKEWVAHKINTPDHYDAGITMRRKSDNVVEVCVHLAGGSTADVRCEVQGIGPKTALAMAAWLIASALEMEGKTSKHVEITIK